MRKLLLMCLPLLMLLTGCSDSSVGVIGGSDGPTAIFVSGPDFPIMIPVLVLLAVVVFAVVFLVTRRK